jgi:predicted DNA-binding transcriptional regulator AlpA
VPKRHPSQAHGRESGMPPLSLEGLAEQFLEHLVARTARDVSAQVVPVLEARLAAALKRLREDLPPRRPSYSQPEPRSTGPRRLGIAELEARLGVNRATVYRWYRAGTFPKPHYIGSRRAWWLHEVSAWEVDQVARPIAERPNNLGPMSAR